MVRFYCVGHKGSVDVPDESVEEYQIARKNKQVDWCSAECPTCGKRLTAPRGMKKDAGSTVDDVDKQ